MTRDPDPPVPGAAATDAAFAPTERLSASTAPTLHLGSPDAVPTEPATTGPGDLDLELLSRQSRFRIERLLGEGGMGKVFKAQDTELGRAVALKVLFASDREADQRFAREAQAQARVDHPHVAKVFETAVHEGRRFIVMQLVEGQSLGEAAEGLTVEQKVRLLRQVAEGVHAAHRIGLVHRDLKPSNVLVTRDEEGALHPYVLDFGIARDLAAGAAMTQTIAGTPWYMAPEQISGDGVDRRTDVYALGVTLYQLLTGKLPITGTGSVDVLVRVLKEDPVPLALVAPRLPGDLGTIVMKCLEKDPARRYDSAKALADDLGRFLDGEPIAARPASRAYRWRMKARKHKLIVVVAAAALVALAALGMVALREAALAGRLEEHAARFGAEAERFEWTLRAERQMPLHDTRPLEDRLRQELDELAGDVEALPKHERAPGHYALGRGAFALGDFEAGERWLDEAWSGGLRSPELAYWRGRAKVRRLREESARHLDGSDPAAHTTAGEAEHVRRRAEAVAALELGRQAKLEANDFAEALLAWADGRPEAARAAAARALEAMPFLYEAYLTIGDVELELALRTTDAAERDEIQSRADAAFAAGAAIGASDVFPYLRLCLSQFERAKRAPGPEPARAHAEAARERCRQAVAADSGQPQAAEALAAVESFLAGLEPVSRAESRGPG